MGGKKERALDRDLANCYGDVLNGYVLAIDPSSGSSGSQPGYSIFRRGEYVDSGFLDIGHGDDIGKRLFRLRETLMNEFDKPDVLVTENIPPFMGKPGGGSFNTSGVVHLHQSVGVVLACWDVPKVRVSPRAWRALLPERYLKTDENDAILLAYTALQYSREAAGLGKTEIPEGLLIKLATGEWPST